MDILSLIGWRREGLEKQGGSPEPSFEVGDRLYGRVSRLLQHNLALVDFLGGRFKAIAELKAPLNPGQRLNFEVSATTPRLTLQIVQSEKGAESATPLSPPPLQTNLQILNPHQIRSLIRELQTLAAVLKRSPANGESVADIAANCNSTEESSKVSTALKRLASHLAPLDQMDPKTTAKQLQAHLRDGGQLLLQKLVDAVQGRELDFDKASDHLKTSGQVLGRPDQGKASATTSHLLQADLKPHLQRLLIHLPTLMEDLDPTQSLSPEASRHLWSTVAALLEEMDSGQARLSEHRPEDPPAVMRHNMWVEGRDEPLRLNVYLPRKGRRKGNPAAPMVSLLLDLERFGAVRVDVRERMGVGDRQQQLSVNFWMNSQDACDDMGAAVAPLEGILEALYPQVDLEVSLAPDKIAAFEQDARPVRPPDSKSGKLDIRI